MVFKNGSINEREAPNVARTILHKTAGHLLKMIYRMETGHFNAVYEAAPGGTSVLYISKTIVYKKGYALDVYPN
jgi:hypothetical protein